jgi:hypothetical protein
MTESDLQQPRRRGPSKLLQGLGSLALLVGLAGVVGPGVVDEVEHLRQQNALQDMQVIVEGLRDYSQDTLTYPTGIEGRTDVGWLYGPGELPSGVPFSGLGQSRPLADALLNPAMGGARWRGPYLEDVPSDPWERAYLVSVSGLVDGRTPALVLSAGPNGVCDTPANSLQPEGDDILLPLN